MNSENNPNLNTIVAICEVFNVSVSDMFTTNEEQFGEHLEKGEEILELKQEIIRKDVKIGEISKKLSEVAKVEPTDDKVKIVMDGDDTVVSIFGKEIECTQITEIDICRKTIEVALKFDELSVK